MPVDTDVTNLHISPYTLGDAIKDKRMWVDTYQRHYAWEADHVRDLYEDFEKVIKQGADAEHFLGSVVVEVKNGRVKIVDGQQRIATTMILLAAMRDHFSKMGEKARAEAYQNEFLYSVNVDTLNPESHLILNTDDHKFFTDRVVLPPDHQQRVIEESKEPSLPSHVQIVKATEIAKEQITKIVKNLPDNEAIERIAKWKDFILQRSRIIWIVVPDDGTAYSVFETMNDRGLSLSATDLLKNLLFALAQEDDSYRAKIQQHWFSMAGTMNSIEMKDAVLTYVRHLWISARTKATVNDLYKVIKRNISGKQGALEFAQLMSDTAPLYAALLSSNHPKWKSYPEEIAEQINAISTLRLQTVRPLLLSGLEQFKKKPDDLRKFLYSIVNWSVRFLVAGRLGSGALEEKYGEAARKLRSNKIKTIGGIKEQLDDVLPPDEEFKNLFSQISVSQPYLQRFYLRSLEVVARDGKDDLEPMKGKYNIEHVLPQAPEKNWKHIPPETIKAYTNRLGNLGLLQIKKNELAADSAFSVKKPILTASPILLTKQMAEYDDWNTPQIKDRQEKLAALAVKAWPLKVP